MQERLWNGFFGGGQSSGGGGGGRLPARCRRWGAGRRFGDATRHQDRTPASHGDVLKLGGMAAVGALAIKAWRDWQAGKAPAGTAEPARRKHAAAPRAGRHALESRRRDGAAAPGPPIVARDHRGRQIRRPRRFHQEQVHYRSGNASACRRGQTRIPRYECEPTARTSASAEAQQARPAVGANLRQPRRWGSTRQRGRPWLPRDAGRHASRAATMTLVAHLQQNVAAASTNAPAAV